MNISSPENLIPSRKHPFKAKIKERFLLNKEGSSKETYHIVLDLKEGKVPFKVGDAVAIFPQNDPLLVQKILEALHISGEEQVIDPRSSTPLSLHDFLTHKANLFRLSSSLIELIATYAMKSEKRQYLHHLVQAENKHLLSDYLTHHCPLSFLQEHPSKSLPLDALCKSFSPLLPRFYSIASSPQAHPEEMHLTVALFTLDHRGQKRYGVASNFLCQLADIETTSIPLYVQSTPHFTLPEDKETHIIMIGPGTGIAPFRGFMQERMHSQASGKNWLFFGERHSLYDFFYEDFWSELISQDKLRLTPAFSRDQAHKVYVQHRLYEHAQEIWQWLEEGAHFYVCGDAHRMAKDVDAILHLIAQEQGNLTEKEAKHFMKNLRHQKRYLLDVY